MKAKLPVTADIMEWDARMWAKECPDSKIDYEEAYCRICHLLSNVLHGEVSPEQVSEMMFNDEDNFE